MNTSVELDQIRAAQETLKDFQRASVEAAYGQLFGDGDRRMLVADEVGLGKTVVAKGIIAKELSKRLQDPTSEGPLRVAYICSNQVIAGENLGKLAVFPDSQVRKEASRLTYLAFKPDTDEHTQLLQLIALTPETSFNTGGGTGAAKERRLIYAALMALEEFRCLDVGLALLLQASVTRQDDWYIRCQQELERDRIRDGLPEQLRDRIACHLIQPDDETTGTEALFGHFYTRSARTLLDAVLQIASMITEDTANGFRRAADELVRRLRGELAEHCLSYMDADLYILDEFQRFRALIDADSETQMSRVARQVFHAEKPVLLLSATPFKPFTNRLDQDANGEDHYRDLRAVLAFLFHKDQDRLAAYDSCRRALGEQLLSLRSGRLGTLTSEHRERMEALLRPVICRTERALVTDGASDLIRDCWRHDQSLLTDGDIENYCATDAAVALTRQLGVVDQEFKPIEYCKSAPRPLSFLQGYAVRKELERARRIPGAQPAFAKTQAAWLDFDAIDKYELRLQGTGRHVLEHGRLSAVANAAIGEHGHGLLWVPPSLPYYPLGRPFNDDPKFTKTLVFSSWVMVPRMLGTLLSYEVERRTVGDPRTRLRRESGERRYFAKEGQDRQPTPRLRFQPAGKDRQRAPNMSNFCLLYPSLTLAEFYDPVDNIAAGRSLSEIFRDLTNRFTEKIKAARLERFVQPGGNPQRWYWAAPVLLDLAQPSSAKPIKDWLHGRSIGDCRFFGEDAQSPSRGKREHLAELRSLSLDPQAAALGPIPEDLAKVLAEICIASPAICSLRSLRRLFDESDDFSVLTSAFEIADSMLDMLNKPESIAAVRLYIPKVAHWQKVLRYAANGCLQAVLDEYLHLLKGQVRTLERSVDRLVNTADIVAGTPHVDSLESFMGNKSPVLRCHYAVPFGSQRLDNDQGRNRARDLRENFNSPFRPFVLATTSIGQEGLDFHNYCRRIVHWNLPGNPIDLEQREGRINRFKGHVIRQQVARRYRGSLTDEQYGCPDIWEALFAAAAQIERVSAQGEHCELIPYWHVRPDEVQIERMIPMYPFSREQERLQRILATLAVYRLAFGQPRQQDFVEVLLKRQFTAEELQVIHQALVVDLSPVSYSRASDPLQDAVSRQGT